MICNHYRTLQSMIRIVELYLKILEITHKSCLDNIKQSDYYGVDNPFLLLNFTPQLSIEELLGFLLAQQSIALRQGFAVGEVQDVWRGRKLEETHGT